MLRFVHLCFVALAVFAGANIVHAALFDQRVQTKTVPVAELVVYEVESCLYCELFRRDVLPGYQASLRHDKAPIRFVDARKTETQSVGLAGAVTIVPTVVLMRDGKEVGRIAGYTGPEMFYQMIGHLFSRIDQ